MGERRCFGKPRHNMTAIEEGQDYRQVSDTPTSQGVNTEQTWLTCLANIVFNQFRQFEAVLLQRTLIQSPAPVKIIDDGRLFGQSICHSAHR